MSRALIIVDVQNDFIDGTLAVPDAAGIFGPLEELIARSRATDDLIVATADWHPSSHCSFVDNDGVWPRHCEAGTHGAALHPLVQEAAQVLVFKGTYPLLEAYSGFSDPLLLETLRDHDVTDVTIAGLATDYCVKATALDAIKHGFKTTVDWAACRGVDPQTTRDAMREIRAAQAAARKAA